MSHQVKQASSLTVRSYRMIQYEKITVGESETIKGTLEDGSIIFIPLDEANSDYQAYLEHEATAK
jgi:hypothetical protein